MALHLYTSLKYYWKYLYDTVSHRQRQWVYKMRPSQNLHLLRFVCVGASIVALWVKLLFPTLVSHIRVLIQVPAALLSTEYYCWAWWSKCMGLCHLHVIPGWSSLGAGFSLAQPWFCVHLGGELADGRSLPPSLCFLNDELCGKIEWVATRDTHSPLESQLLHF